MSTDPYRYFRIEARELLDALSGGILRLEHGDRDPDVIAALLRSAHTLKGAARIVRRPDLADLAHRIEDILAPHRGGSAVVPAAEVREVLRLVDGIRAGVRSLDPAAPERPADDAIESVRVDLADVDEVLRRVQAVGVQLGAVRRELEGVAGAAARAVAERAEAEVAQLRAALHRLRLVRVRTLFAALERALRDAAESQGKRVALVTDGGDTRLDAVVLGALQGPLLHVVRNAVAHGIELPEERRAAGKAAVGVVRVSVARRNADAVITCQDDGRGIDVVAVAAAARARGLAAPADEAEAARLLLDGGLSTRQEVTELAGRGIGLDVVRDAVQRLKGQVTLTSERGRGVAIELRIPASVASIPALLVEAAGRVAIPLDAVGETVRITSAELAHGPTGTAVAYGGALIPFRPLRRVLARPDAASPPAAWSAVIVRGGGGTAALGVERLLGTSELIVRSLPAIAAADPAVAGAAFDADGDPLLIVDPDAVVASARHADPRPPAPSRPPPILVIDDSLTTRMLEQTILESAGYDVEVATSAEEALEKARQRRYALFLVDVEMPGMDGFTFVATTRADAILRDVPAILVTSRDAPEDRRRGEEVGALAYVVKSDFDQGRLLALIRRTVGEP